MKCDWLHWKDGISDKMTRHPTTLSAHARMKPPHIPATGAGRCGAPVPSRAAAPLTLVSGEGAVCRVVENQLEALVGGLKLAAHLVDQAESQVHLVGVRKARVGVQHVL